MIVLLEPRISGEVRDGICKKIGAKFGFVLKWTDLVVASGCFGTKRRSN